VANIQIPALPPVISLTGTEEFEVVQGGVSSRATTAQLAILALGQSVPYAISIGGTGATTASGARTNLGLGTMAVQNANLVAITGGTIQGVAITLDSLDNTPIGANTPSTGAFTTLSATTPLPVSSGGTGQASNWTQWGAIYASTTGILASTATGTTGQPLLANSTSGPAFGNMALGVANTNVTGALTVTNGGIGVATLASNGVLYGNGTGAILATAVGATGQVLIGNTGAAPTWGAATDVAVTSLSFGTTGLTPNSATTGAIVVAGTLAIANGGTGITSFGTGVATALGTNVNGSGAIALTTNAVFVTPTLGVASATTINKVTLTAPATGSTLTILDGKTLTINNTMTLAAGADGQTWTFPSTSDTVVTLGATQTLTAKTLTTPILNGTPTGTGVATAATANTLVLRDSSGNISSASFNSSFLAWFNALQTSLPGSAGVAWNNGGTVSVS